METFRQLALFPVTGFDKAARFLGDPVKLNELIYSILSSTVNNAKNPILYIVANKQHI